jgi:uncharacterized protein YndB with AHSA1/START domain
MGRSTFLYVTYIRTTPEKLWAALTEPEFMKQYWFGMHGQSDWTVGSPWKLLAADGRTAAEGEIVESDPPRRLVFRWQDRTRPELEAEGPSLCSMVLAPESGAVKLTITHTIERDDARVIVAVSGGWPKVLSNLKTLLETGSDAFAPLATC